MASSWPFGLFSPGYDTKACWLVERFWLTGEPLPKIQTAVCVASLGHDMASANWASLGSGSPVRSSTGLGQRPMTTCAWAFASQMGWRGAQPCWNSAFCTCDVRL